MPSASKSTNEDFPDTLESCLSFAALNHRCSGFFVSASSATSLCDDRPEMNYLFYNLIENSHKYCGWGWRSERARSSPIPGRDKRRQLRKTDSKRKEKRVLLANYQRFNLSYYNLHTADAHIDLFEPRRDIRRSEMQKQRRSEEDERGKQNRQALV